jgi:DNA gyrase/topoisomerase IV subunit B
MAKDKTYTGADIQALSDREHVRLRTQIYLGSMSPTIYAIPLLTEDTLSVKEVEFIPSVYKAIGEVVDNALDEFSHLTTRIKLLKLDAKPDIGWYSVGDNGRGIPIDTHATGVPTPQIALGSLKAGRNFTDDKEVGVIGQNGVGAACTNYCSSEFDVVINRDGKQYHQRFVDGADKVSKPKITKPTTPQPTGTKVTFQLDPLVFKSVALPEELIRNRAIEIAITNPDVTVEYNGKRYRYKKGLIELVAQIAGDKQFYAFEINELNVVGEIFVILNAHDRPDSQMFTWVNSSMLFDGGKCNTQFFNAFTARVQAELASTAKKMKIEITNEDITRGMLVLASLKVKNPEYDSQAKTRLTGPDLRRELVGSIDNQWKAFAKKTSQWLDEVIEHANSRYHRQADREALKEHEKKMRKPVPGLLDATGKDRMKCRILITEGDSAKSQISEVRDPTTTAAFALTGKINNVYDATPAQALKMGKISELLLAIGLTPGKRAVRSELNYGEIVVATDADYDGDDIFTLLVNMFYKFWPELFDPKYPPIIKRLVAPNVCVVKGKTRIHFTRRSEYEAVKEKYKGYEVRYYKGLGSMAPADWEMILSGKSDTMISIVDDGKVKDVLTLLFSDDADARKAWLTNPLE